MTRSTSVALTKAYRGNSVALVTGDAACSSTNDGEGSPASWLGTWSFKPDAGAMVSRPDTDYLYFGWWVRMDKGGGPTAASAFTGEVGNVDDDPSTVEEEITVSGGTLTGSATYVGHAAGQFALNNPIDGTGDGGHFTADATLNARFGTETEKVSEPGMTGVIDNFMANGKSVPWSVELKLGGWGVGGVINAPAGDYAPGTVWSVDGNKAPASGTWSGQMYDETPGPAPDGDGNNVPTTVIGTFYSEFNDNNGRMAGAFGANRQ